MQLRPYQEEALRHMLFEGRFIYGDAAGTGKTATTLTWLRELGSSRPLIVVPNATILRQWQAQAEDWYPELEMVDGRGTPQQRAAKREAHGGALLLNYELIRQDRTKLVDMHFDALVCDEAHLLKNRQTQLFKAMRLLARRVEALALLTGTPIMNRADESWSALHLIDFRTWPSYHRWAKDHFEYELTTFHGKLPRPIPQVGDVLKGHEEIIAEEVGDVLIARPLEYCLPDMPEVTETVLEVEFSDEERRIYNSLAKREWADLGGGKIIKAKGAAVLNTRLRQLTSDWNGLDPRPSVGAKVDAVCDLLDELEPEQVVVIAGFKATVEVLADAYDNTYQSIDFIHGGISVGDRHLALDRFRRGDVRILVGTHGTIGTGVDGLQIARHIVLLDQDWTPARNDQAIGRVRRSGQLAGVNVWKIVVTNSLDQSVMAALDHKLNVIDAIVGANYDRFISGDWTP